MYCLGVYIGGNGVRGRLLSVPDGGCPSDALDRPSPGPMVGCSSNKLPSDLSLRD